MTAELSGSGAIAQGENATAAGEGAVVISGDINAPTNITIHHALDSSADCKDLRQAYLANLYTEANQLPLFGGEPGKHQAQLSSVYTALLTSATDAEAHPQRLERRDGSHEHLSALDVLNREPKLVLLGGPGSGKSTFLSFVALCMAGEMLGEASNLRTLRTPLPQSEGKEAPGPQSWDQGALLSVRVVLRDFAAQLPEPGTRIGANTLWDFICGQLRQQSLEPFASHLKAELLKQGGLVLLDGLDEVPEADRRREQVKQAVQSFAATYHRCRFAVTSRTYAYQQQEWKLEGFTDVQLLPFGPAQIHAFVGVWYQHMTALRRLSQPEAQARAQRLKHLVDHNERIRELAERPLLLTLMAKLQAERGGTLPEKREELYDRAVDMLLSQWEEMKPRGFEPNGTPRYDPSLSEFLDTGRDAIRKQLNHLAFQAHRDQQELRGTAAIAKPQLINALLNANPKRHTEVKVGLLEGYLRDRSGLLVTHGVDLYQFPHRSFQEYLAACHLTNDGFPRKLAQLAREDATRWREVALLAGAKAGGGAADNVWRLAEALCPRAVPDGDIPLPAQWGALLAGELLVQSAELETVEDYDADKLERVRQWQCWLLQRGALPAVERALAGRTLAVLGDPRPEIMQLDRMQFCLVPAGTFVMGSNEGLHEERPRHTVELPYAYFIARFPVSVAQWRQYLQNEDTAPETSRRWGRDNDPVVNVSWHDVLQFCNALNKRWHSQLPSGWIVSLPSEAEWEKAARGGEYVPKQPMSVRLSEVEEALRAESRVTLNQLAERKYPWGKLFEPERANAAMDIGELSGLGCYAEGRSPYGCEEMCGNVWEWTRSLWGADLRTTQFGYPYRPQDLKRESLTTLDNTCRVLRGGAFGFNADVARCACRGRNLPGHRSGYAGFRVVLRGPPVL